MALILHGPSQLPEPGNAPLQAIKGGGEKYNKKPPFQTLTLPRRRSRRNRSHERHKISMFTLFTFFLTLTLPFFIPLAIASHPFTFVSFSFGKK